MDRRFLAVLILAAGLGRAQRSDRQFEIKVPAGVPSESLFIRYVLSGEGFGNWVSPRPNVSSFLISTVRVGRPVDRIKALLYAPGCALQTIDSPVSASYSFVCEPLPTIHITGQLTQADRLYGRHVTLRAKYVARWAKSFLGLPDEIPGIWVGEGSLATGGIDVTVPDFSQDPIAGAPDHAGELQIWAIDTTSGDKVAQLVPIGSQSVRTRMGGFTIPAALPSETVFAACSPGPFRLHDTFGFAHRPVTPDACDH